MIYSHYSHVHTHFKNRVSLSSASKTVVEEALEAANQLIPPNRAQVVLVLVVKIYGPNRAPRGGVAHLVAARQRRVAGEPLAVEGKRVCVFEKRRLELVALVKRVGFVGAFACGVGACAEEDLKMEIRGVIKDEIGGGVLTPPKDRCSIDRGDAVMVAAMVAAAMEVARFMVCINFVEG